MFSLQHKFHISALYHQPVETMRGYLTKRWSFWLALFSCIAFLIGNMVGQHGFDAFWKSVWGKEDDMAIVFTGTVPPIAMIPDPERWNGDSRTYSFSDVPKSLLIPFPKYKPITNCSDELSLDRRIISVDYNGDYRSGCINSGSHPANDILVPKGTPVVSMANGYVERVEERSWGFGNTIVIRHPNVPDPENSDKKTTLYSSYAHLDSILVKVGEIVEKGQLIALSGQSGFATAPHLHVQLDRASAPFHPYWPFTTSEAAEQGVSFVEAVNRGIGKEKAKEFTVNPLAFVELFKDWSGVRTLVAQDNDSRGATVQDIVVGTVRIKEQKEKIQRTLSPNPQDLWRMARARMRVRRAERIANQSQRRSTIALKPDIAPKVEPKKSSQPEPADTSKDTVKPVEIIPQEKSTPIVLSTPVIQKAVPIPKAVGHVTSISILHDGAFDNDWEQIVLFARDAEGNFVKDVRFEGEITLDASFGSAQFSPSALTAEQFDDRGRAFIKMLPNGTKTVIPAVSGVFQAKGEPMVYQPEGTKISQR